MATRAKNASNGKGKSRSYPSTPRHNDLSNERKTPKTLTTTSTVKGLSLLSGKPSPHYLKPTISSANDVCKYGNREASDDSSLKHSLCRRRSYEKPPSQSQLQRTASASPRIRTIKPSCPPPKKASSPKPISERTPKQSLERTPKTPRVVKSQPVFTKPESIKRRTSTTTKKESKVTSSSANTTPTSLFVTKTQRTKAAQKDKARLMQEVEQETIKVVDKELIGPEILLSVLNETPIDPIYSKTETNASKSLTLSEQQLETAPHIEEAENDNHQEEEEQDDNNNNEDSIEHNEPKVEANGGEENMIEKRRILRGNSASINDSSDENKPHKLKFRKGTEMEEKEDENGEMQRLKFKQREGDVDEVDDGKAEQENVVLKKQDVQGKKESPKYNDVIEETVSKLVEKRKSKVKALVGAFETVISLQENETQQSEGTKTP